MIEHIIIKVKIYVKKVLKTLIIHLVFKKDNGQ